MQFYLNGYTPGDPFIEDPHPVVAERPGGLPEDVDVLIIGSGPAGLVLAAQMAEFPEIRAAVIERKDGPLEVGQADGVACRTVEMFEAFGLADRLVSEAYWVNEVPPSSHSSSTRCWSRPTPRSSFEGMGVRSRGRGARFARAFMSRLAHLLGRHDRQHRRRRRPPRSVSAPAG
jgi:choline dehydrogenase-like flavoprotein